MPKSHAAFQRYIPKAEPAAAGFETARQPSHYTLAALLLLLAGSGCAALIYEIVWFQLLQLVIGSSAVSLGLLLAFYMGGLCAGSALFGRLVSSRLDPRRVYALIEFGIGGFGILALLGVPLVGQLNSMGPSSGLAGLVFRGFTAGVCLAPPALLMGCTFPAASRALGSRADGASLGLLYSANTLGAVAGCVIAGFYLLRLYDLGVATYTAAAINTAVALAALCLPAQPTPERTGGTNPTPGMPPAPARGVSWIYASIALSGVSALGAEVVWTRLLSLLLGATVYTFSIILAVFLAGLWAGSSGGALLARRAVFKDRYRGSRLALGASQMLLAIACAWTAHALARSLPYWPVDPALSIDPWMNFELDVIRCAFAILPAALLWGASFPLALACAAGEEEDPARLTGAVYAANTAGAIVGALLFSLLLIPAVGTAGSQQILVWVAAAGALAALLPLVTLPGARVARVLACAAVALALSAGLSIPEVPWQMVAYGRRVAPILRAAQVGSLQDQPTPLFLGEGTSSSVVISQRGDQRMFYVSGKSEASSAPVDMRLQRMMGHLPALLHPNPRTVLVVGFGAGVTAGSFIPYPEVQRIVIAELEPLIPQASGKFFAKENNNVIGDPRTKVVYDDARHYILTADKFDVITTDPIHPWVKGTSALYSKEYYELVRQHLNPGGIAAQWLPLYESDEDTVKTELATFFSVFEGGTVWSNFQDGEGYDLVLLGRKEESAIDINAMDRRLKAAAYANVSKSLAEVGLPSAAELLATYAGRAQDLQPLLRGAQINDDLSMRLQYMAGFGLNSSDSAGLYREILAFRKYPEELLTGAGEPAAALRERLQRPHLTF